MFPVEQVGLSEQECYDRLVMSAMARDTVPHLLSRLGCFQVQRELPCVTVAGYFHQWKTVTTCATPEW